MGRNKASSESSRRVVEHLIALEGGQQLEGSCVPGGEQLDDARVGGERLRALPAESAYYTRPAFACRYVKVDTLW